MQRKHQTVPVGRRFGKQSVVRYSHAEYKADRKVPRWIDYWIVQCDCGDVRTTEASPIANGHVLACSGCNPRSATHNLCGSSEYTIWQAMKERCYNSNHSAFRHYGGRGITICARWLESFENFYADMGSRPSSAHSINRINNDGDYTPENCEWATQQEQMSNYSKSVHLTYAGETLTMSEWARRAGLHRATLRTRIVTCGWSLGQALGMEAR